jgi:hypothetical protein
MGMGMEELALALLARRAFAQFQFINFLLFRRKNTNFKRIEY